MPRKKRKKIREEAISRDLSPEAKKGIIVIFLFAIGLLTFLSLFSLAGRVGVFIDSALGIFIGWTKFAFPFILIVYAYLLLRDERYEITKIKYIGFLVFILAFNAILHISYDMSELVEMAAKGSGGGFVGLVLNYPLQFIMGPVATVIILIALVLVGLVMVFNAPLQNLIISNSSFEFMKRPFGFLWRSRKNEDEDEKDADEDNEEDETEENEQTEKDEDIEDDSKEDKHVEPEKEVIPFPVKKIKIDLPLNLLRKKGSKPTSGDIKAIMEKIQKTLKNFGIDVQMEGISIGPTVTQYTFRPAEGVKLSRITALNNDLALALAAHPIRIEAPIPGKSLVGIEVPNKQAALVGLRELLEAKEFKNRKSNLTITLGKDVTGKTWTYPLGKMPHLLVAGATGSGKSVCLNTIVLSLIYQNNPDTLRLILVDPKRVEFPVYNGIPHLLSPVITDVTKTVNALRWAIAEMDRRYDILSKAGKRNIESYNEIHPDEKMPYLIIVVDELADLMVAASAEIETAVIRITQMARAIGIHMILATQRPSVDVITGLIKANIPARIAFSVASLMDSRTILDSAGAEKLLGKGDMLFQTAELSKPRRIQGAFVSDDEIKRVVRFLKDAGGEPKYNENVTEKNKGATSFDYKSSDEDDELYDEAKEIVVRAGKASASLLQRRLRIGYARAARLIDILEDNGIVGPPDGARPRDVLISLDKLSQGSTREIEEEEDTDKEYEEAEDK